MFDPSLSVYEIMAPVGSRESLAAAIQAGADSVYFGIGQLNMRSHSANKFTIDDLKEIAATCKEKGIKTYLTVNTIIYGEDIPMMRQIVDAAKEAGISAVIASDVAVMTYCQQVQQEVHLSTQLNISNIEALRFYAQFADVVVLARELNISQVAEIYRQIQEEHICGPSGELIRIEMFCHGALCMAVSGKCYLSLKNPVDVSDVFRRYLTPGGTIDIEAFLRNIFCIESSSSYMHAFELAGVEACMPYGEMRLAAPLDIARVRRGESKYLLRELFAKLYPGLEAPEKIPMPRATEQWFAGWGGPRRPEFIPGCQAGMTGDQKWLVWCLEQFLEMHDKVL